jgi:hypothetical protein
MHGQPSGPSVQVQCDSIMTAANKYEKNLVVVYVVYFLFEMNLVYSGTMVSGGLVYRKQQQEQKYMKDRIEKALGL